MSEQKDLFKYNDGSGGDVFGDPAAIHRGILLSDESVNELYKLAFMKMEDLTREQIIASRKAEERLIGLVREVFKMIPFSKDGSGASDTDCLSVWIQWCKFMKETSA